MLSRLTHNLKHLAYRTMASGVAPAFNPFTLTLVQLGSVGFDKAANLKHAREMILKAAKSGSGMKPQVVVLPVRSQFSSSATSYLKLFLGMFQLALQPCSVPCICREYWLHSWPGV